MSLSRMIAEAAASGAPGSPVAAAEIIAAADHRFVLDDLFMEAAAGARGSVGFDLRARALHLLSPPSPVAWFEHLAIDGALEGWLVCSPPGERRVTIEPFVHGAGRTAPWGGAVYGVNRPAGPIMPPSEGELAALEAAGGSYLGADLGMALRWTGGGEGAARAVVSRIGPLEMWGQMQLWGRLSARCERHVAAWAVTDEGVWKLKVSFWRMMGVLWLLEDRGV